MIIRKSLTEVITSEREKAAVDALHLEPRQPGPKDNYIRLTPRALTGRLATSEGVEIGTDPFVYGVGASLGQGGVVTAVLPRDELDYIRVEFAKRSKEEQETRDVPVRDRLARWDAVLGKDALAAIENEARTMQAGSRGQWPSKTGRFQSPKSRKSSQSSSPEKLPRAWARQAEVGGPTSVASGESAGPGSNRGARTPGCRR